MTLCRIRVTRDTPETGAFEWVTLGAQGAVLASGAGNLDHSPVSGACELVLAADLVTIETVAAPASQQKRLGTALRYLAEDIALPEPERLHVAAAPGPDRNSMCLALVDRRWLQSLLARMRQAKLSVQSAYPECLLPALMPRTWTVVWNGSEGFARTAQSEAFALDLAGPGEVPMALRLALGRVRASGTLPQALVVRSTANAAPPDVQAWSAALDVPVEAGPQWHWASAQPRPAFELLQGEIAARGSSDNWLRRLQRPAILAATLLALSTLGIALDWAAKARERDALLTEMRALYRESFGEAAVVVDAPLQMHRALADLRRQAGHIAPGDFLALLGNATEGLLDPGRHRIESITYGNGALTVALRVPPGQNPAAMLEALRTSAQKQGLDAQAEVSQTPGMVMLRVVPGRARE
jgi:general secretion pathway protein L